MKCQAYLSELWFPQDLGPSSPHHTDKLSNAVAQIFFFFKQVSYPNFLLILCGKIGLIQATLLLLEGEVLLSCSDL